LARVVVVASLVPVLARLSLPRQAAILSRPPKGAGGAGRATNQRDPDQMVRCLDLAQGVARPLVRPGCLTRAITLYWFLGRGDDSVQLCFGLGHPVSGDDYSGHCWLTRAGEPFLERVDPTEIFGVVYRIPAAPR